MRATVQTRGELLGVQGESVDHHGDCSGRQVAPGDDAGRRAASGASAEGVRSTACAAGLQASARWRDHELRHFLSLPDGGGLEARKPVDAHAVPLSPVSLHALLPLLLGR